MIDITHVGAFLTGVGAVLSAIVSLRLTQKRLARECAERIEEVREAMREGYRMGHGE